MRLKIKLQVIVDIFLMLAMIMSAVTGILLLLGPSGPGKQNNAEGKQQEMKEHEQKKRKENHE